MFLAYFLDKGIFSYDFFNHGIGVSAGTFIFLPLAVIFLLGLMFWIAIPIYCYGLRQALDPKKKLTKLQNIKSASAILAVNTSILISFVIVGLKDGSFLNVPHIIILVFLPLLLVLNLTTPAIRDVWGRNGIKFSYVVHLAYYSIWLLIIILNSTVSGLMASSLQIFNVGGMVPVKIIKQPNHDEDVKFEKWGKLVFRSPNEAYVQETSESGDFIMIYQLQSNVILQRSKFIEQNNKVK